VWSPRIGLHDIRQKLAAPGEAISNSFSSAYQPHQQVVANIHPSRQGKVEVLPS
jgi:hypothetical protein